MSRISLVSKMKRLLVCATLLTAAMPDSAPEATVRVAPGLATWTHLDTCNVNRLMRNLHLLDQFLPVVYVASCCGIGLGGSQTGLVINWYAASPNMMITNNGYRSHRSLAAISAARFGSCVCSRFNSCCIAS